MRKIEFLVKVGAMRRYHDAAIMATGDTLREGLIEAVIEGLSTTIEVTAGGVTMHLAAWMDPDHWAEDWEAAGVEDVDLLLAGAEIRE